MLAGGALSGCDDLTSRELEVLQFVAEGMSNTEIGSRLHVCEATVKYHVSALLRKLRLRDRLQLAVFAYKQGIAMPWRS
ncbi:LuxR C-terminal-related transcriptional regulator [Dactylosporangium sp. NPDC050588]|uniref:helix-turn-helix domain-containing protein n=1 Tax=Dactylosporangium sp. NPDC050588 TaxID=3157211 RepID=UPI0033E73AD7